MARMVDGRFDEALACAVRQLPDLRGAIEAEYVRSPDFRGLCEDYRLCVDAATRWEASDAPTAAVRRQEYAQWLRELEAEIAEWLDAVSAGRKTNAGEAS